MRRAHRKPRRAAEAGADHVALPLGQHGAQPHHADPPVHLFVRDFQVNCRLADADESFAQFFDGHPDNLEPGTDNRRRRTMTAVGTGNRQGAGPQPDLD
ncbi:hypothetical protein [Streptomyces axinellae]|uniref:Uncharacterized protein n=1 Tax=Streptomyces axinellae TaxID=552788 RepID=A0ABP6C4W0_9ACTN